MPGRTLINHQGGKHKVQKPYPMFDRIFAVDVSAGRSART